MDAGCSIFRTILLPSATPDPSLCLLHLISHSSACPDPSLHFLRLLTHPCTFFISSPILVHLLACLFTFCIS